MPTYADHTIEYWGNVYQACRLEKENITFASFIESPQSILEALGMDDAMEIMESGFLPLLPKQARLRVRLDKQSHFRQKLIGERVKLTSDIVRHQRLGNEESSLAAA